MRSNIRDAVSITVTTLLLGILLVRTPSFVLGELAFAQDKHDSKHTVSKALAKPLKAAQEDIQAKKYSDALAKLRAVQTMPNKSPYEEHLLSELLGFAYYRTGNYPEAARTLEAGLNDGLLEASEVPGRVKALTQLNMQIKNYEKAIEFGERAIKGGFADEAVNTAVGQAHYLKNDWKGTLKFQGSIVDAEIKRGQTPKSEQLELIRSSCVKLDDTDCATRALERLVAYYPKTEYWQQLIYTMFRSPSTNDKNLLQTYRLASEVDVLKRPEDYTEMAQLAIEQGSPGEAQQILEKGFRKNIFADARSQDKNKRLLESAKKAATADLASLPKIETDAAAAKTGDKDVGLGLAYLGYEQYDKATDALSKGLAKDGLRSEPEARLLLGIAQLKSGHKDEAVKSFHAVKGDPALERLANLWSLHSRQF